MEAKGIFETFDDALIAVIFKKAFSDNVRNMMLANTTMRDQMIRVMREMFSTASVKDRARLYLNSGEDYK